MLSPHSKGFGPYEDAYPHRTIYEQEERLITMGYKFLGWANSGGHETPEYKHCVNEAHNYQTAFPGAWKSVQHTPSGSDVTRWCTKCRIYWKVDMS